MGLSASLAEPVHLNVVCDNRASVSQRTPSPARQPASGPWLTGDVQLKLPPAWTKPVETSKAPPPVRVTCPVGNPPMPLALNPNPTCELAAPAADAVS